MKIPLADWASRHYNPAPSAYVLRKWVRDGQITPVPELVGGAYYVAEDAQRRVAKRPPLVDRLRQHLHTA